MNEIADKLEHLRKYVNFLKQHQKISLNEFEKNSIIRGAIERNLHLALECVIDIGEIIISKEKLKKPEKYKDIILILGDANILPKKFAIKFAPALGFRNILVHMYTEIDIKKEYTLLKNNLDDFNVFAVAVSKYLTANLKQKNTVKHQ